MADLIKVVYRKGIYLPEADLWLDPHFGVPKAFISHAHSDHVARHGHTYCSETTALLITERYGKRKKGLIETLPLRTNLDVPGWQLRLLPAGHIIGSAMLHLTRLADGATLLYTGDYKLRPGLSCERCELAQADTLIMETTFGLPMYRFPPLEQTVATAHHFVRTTLAKGETPLLLGYSLGKAQEILCALAGASAPVMVHDAVLKMTNAIAHLLEGKLPAYQPFDAATANSHALVFPPAGSKPSALAALPGVRTAMFTGWALQPAAKYRYRVDEMFPLSDHADYDELLETVAQVKPRRVYTVHGYTREFAADLRRMGHEAWSLERADQLELKL